RLAKLAAREKDDTKLIEEIFLAILCRKPTKAEVANGLKALEGAGAEYPKLLEEYNRRLAVVTDYEKQLPAKQAEWEKQAQQSMSWTVLDIAQATSAKGVTLTKQPDGSILASGSTPTTDTYTLTANTKLPKITGIRLEVLPDP